jgi:hypothetical protein
VYVRLAFDPGCKAKLTWFVGGSSGSEYLSVYLTGLQDSSVASPSSSVSSNPSSTSSAKPSVVVTVTGNHLTLDAEVKS